MNSKATAGFVLLLGGITAYIAGVFVPYTGRAFSGTAVMIGITLLAVGQRSQQEDP